ncbi:MAG TPA: molybdopterin oxidoreductase family protein [Actinophytocola sp.]|uniref:molybdopterin oxidoreductase family protein n=1 Tax=Actinophytocola sp. TaxID=1872138 RepID=UPI002DDCF344|nr:molybdopterin oxidoreductase family protein [Actinophytocola sp.]HEV2780606.1 molybdopterin oxidoreductase family protein [Actinophytocola sp.]
MATTHLHTCTLCEANCGIAVTVEGGRVIDIRGDEDDPFSAGYICPKATALADLQHDPDRLRRPVVRDGDGWREVGWDEAFDLVGRRLREIRAAHGRDAVAVYQGNPTAHNLGLVTYGQVLFRGLGTRNLFSATSVDQLPTMLAAYLMLGNQVLMPVPDLDRTELFVCLGGNPAVSNGSIMTAPNVRARLKGIRARGGRVVVLDPRRTETADLADRHLFLRPGTDALLLLSVVNVLFAESLVRLGRLGRYVSGVDGLRSAAEPFGPERTAAATGVAPEDVRWLARMLSGAFRAVLYGRVGTCTQEFGGLTQWLILAINVLTGRLDEPGGAMFTTPAVDAVPLVAMSKFRGSFGRYRSRVRGLPEFGGELPVVALAEEIETPGDGQVRALITAAGNPVLSTPNGARLERALSGLDFMVSIDPYINETTRLAHVILPPTLHLERSHYELILANYSIRNVAKYSPPVFERGPDQRHDWEICVELAARVLGRGNPVLRGAGAVAAALGRRLPPESLLDLWLRIGPYGLRAGPRGLSLSRLKNQPHGVDLGPLLPRLPGRLGPRSRRINLAPRQFLDDLPRLRGRLRAAPDGLVLIGRRQLRSNNSWMHNSERLVKGRPRCTLLMHPEDAAARGLAAGDVAELSSASGTVEVPVEVTDSIMPGVVSLPHGWGHGRPGVRLAVAAAHPGASVNDVTDERFVDALTGTAAFSGVPVRVKAMVPAQ